MFVFAKLGAFLSRMTLCALGITLAGCAAIDEKHYFGSYVKSPTADNPTGLVNIFRLTVDGNAGLSNVRYIAGEYDERAVDYFLNEVKSEPYEPSDGKGYGPDQIFRLKCSTEDDESDKQDNDNAASDDEATESVTCTTDEVGQLKLANLSTNKNRQHNDTFVIIMSSNANAISETIGAFAENTVVIQSLNYLMNRDTFQAEQVLDATASLVSIERTAVLKLLTDGFADLNNRGEPGYQYELALLQSIAVALEPESAVVFSTLEEAKVWFATVD